MPHTHESDSQTDCPYDDTTIDAETPLVLVVDDDVNTRDAVEALLEIDGYHVATAADGIDALHLLDAGLHPALIVLDLTMPRMDGVEFRRAQLSDPTLADIPVIVCSGRVELADSIAGLGSVVVLRKPLTVNNLRMAVHRQCPLPDATASL